MSKSGEHKSVSQASQVNPPANELIAKLKEYNKEGSNHFYHCTAYSEGQYCCTDPEHENFKELLALIESYANKQKEAFVETSNGER